MHVSILSCICLCMCLWGCVFLNFRMHVYLCLRTSMCMCILRFVCFSEYMRLRIADIYYFIYLFITVSAYFFPRLCTWLYACLCACFLPSLCTWPYACVRAYFFPSLCTWLYECVCERTAKKEEQKVSYLRNKNMLIF